ncbi:MAG: PDZ domain-containing protein [Nocardioidaceae bacterium]|nr:PDZ domain-containing protein [Nocardioidaceae bacterium]
MTENDPRPQQDDTQRLSPETTHRYDERRYDEPRSPYASPPQGPFFASSRPDEPRREERRSRPGAGVVAAILVAALAVGGLAGVVGAAGFSLVSDAVGGDSPSSSSPASSSSVVNQKKAPVDPDSAEAVANKVLPSVVKINVSGQQGQGSGSGVVISSDGEVLTNNHVVDIASQGGQISVNFNDGSAKKATVVGTDPLTDLAVIKVDGVSGRQPASIGHSDKLSVGEPVVAVGSPVGLEATVTSGIVSALNRPVSVGTQDGQSQDTTYPAIQTDAAINPGNSGGPLVDMNGNVIGINSSIRTASSGVESQGGSIGLGFAIPITPVWPVVQELRHSETPTHARIGVQVTDASSNNGLLTGAGIESVNQGSAAEKAGLKRGDVVTKVNDDVITGADSLVATIRGHRPGDKVTLTVVSSGDKTRTVQVTLDSDGGAANS